MTTIVPSTTLAACDDRQVLPVGLDDGPTECPVDDVSWDAFGPHFTGGITAEAEGYRPTSDWDLDVRPVVNSEEERPIRAALGAATTHVGG